ncbi:MAG: ABC transporter substrate-binding protein [Dehalococcoidia bacterium]
MIGRVLPTALTLAAMVVTACAPAAPVTPASSLPPQGGPQLADQQRLVLGVVGLAPTMDPQVSLTGSVRRYDMFETLVWQDDSGKEVLPLLASEWKLVDPTTWRFTLRKDAKFHDGTPVTAADVEFTWQRAQKPELKSVIPGNIGTVANVRAIDPSTVEIATKAADPLLLKRLALLAVLPKAYIERVGDPEFGLKPIGSGPYRFVEFKPDAQVVVQAWKEHAYRKPILTEVVIRSVPDGSARINGLRTGEIDYANALSIEGAEQLKREGFSVDVANSGSGGYAMDTWGIDGPITGPLADKRVRQAINYAVDKDTLAKTIWKGFTSPESQLVQKQTVGFNAELKPYPFDVTKAKQLLADAGYANGFKLTMDYWIISPEGMATALYVQSQLKAVGIEVDLNAFTEYPVLVDKLYKRKPRADILAFGLRNIPTVDSDTVLAWFWSGQKSLGKHYDNPAYDEVYLASAKEMDAAKREKLLGQALSILREDAPWLYLVEGALVNAAAKSVGGPTVRIPDDFRLDVVYRTK